MRDRIYLMIKKVSPGERVSKVYNIFIVVIAFISVTPMMFRGQNLILDYIDLVTMYILFVDYIFRWITVDYSSGEKGIKPFIKYPFTPLAVLDFVSLLPSMNLISQSFKILRVFRIFKILRYLKSFRYIEKVFKKEKKPLLTVLIIASFYIFISALAIFQYEPDSFESFPAACYWITASLTFADSGYLSPATFEGRLVSTISGLAGLIVVSICTGTITAGFVGEIRDRHNDDGYDKTGDFAYVPLTPIDIPRHVAVMSIGVFMNFFFSMLVQKLNLPLWLDITGTVFTALALGPVEGLLVGLVDNFYLALFRFETGSLMFYAVSALIALLTGLYLKKDGKIKLNRILPAILLAIVASSVLSTAIGLWVTPGTAPVFYWEQVYYDSAMALGVPYFLSYLWGAFVVNVYDHIVVSGIAAVFYMLLPKRVTGRASHSMTSV